MDKYFIKTYTRYFLIVAIILSILDFFVTMFGTMYNGINVEGNIIVKNMIINTSYFMWFLLKVVFCVIIYFAYVSINKLNNYLKNINLAKIINGFYLIFLILLSYNFIDALMSWIYLILIVR